LTAEVVTLHSKPPYEFKPADPGIFVEIYLPKKADFQGTLYDTLAKGFYKDQVISHFKNPEKRPGIKRLLKRFKDVVRYVENEVDQFPAVFFGYSLYEVDGVFISDRNGIQAERTQIIRIMFRPTLSEFYENNPGEKNRKIISRIAKEYLRAPEGRRVFKIERNLTPLQREVVEYLEKWTDYVGVFVFGYLVFEICEQITRLCSKGETSWDQAEDEIWVTSFWNLNINPVKLVLPKKRVRTGRA
jgi:hypothetical protein